MAGLGGFGGDDGEVGIGFGDGLGIGGGGFSGGGLSDGAAGGFTSGESASGGFGPGFTSSSGGLPGDPFGGMPGGFGPGFSAPEGGLPGDPFGGMDVPSAPDKPDYLGSVNAPAAAVALAAGLFGLAVGGPMAAISMARGGAAAGGWLSENMGDIDMPSGVEGMTPGVGPGEGPHDGNDPGAAGPDDLAPAGPGGPSVGRDPTGQFRPSMRAATFDLGPGYGGQGIAVDEPTGGAYRIRRA